MLGRCIYGDIVQTRNSQNRARDALRFGTFVLDLTVRELRNDDVPVNMGARAFDLLSILAQNPGRVLTKAELISAAWPGVTVDENNLHVQVSALRKILGARMIATAPGRGYQFTGEVFLEGAHPAPTIVPEKSIAVLAFDDMSEGQDQQYFADGIAEEITNALVKAGGLLVAGRTSAFAFRGKARDLREVGRSLSVAHILEGSVRRRSDRLRITAQLIRVSDGFHLWSNTFEGSLTEIFDLQEAIARAIVGELDPLLGVAGEERLAPHLTGSREAHDLLLQARAIYRSTPSEHSFAVAEDMLNRAVALDPDFALAWIEIANLNNFASSYIAQRSLKNSFATSRAAVARAAAVDPHVPRVKIWSAHVRYYEGDLVGSYALALEAHASAPDDAMVLFALAHFNGLYGYSQKALPLLEKANRIDPFDGFAWTTRAMICQNLGDFDSAERFATRAAELGDVVALDVLCWNAFQRGEPEVAIERHGRLCDLAGMVWPNWDKPAKWRTYADAFYRGDAACKSAICANLRTAFDQPGFEPTGFDIVDAGHFELFDDLYTQWRHVYAGKSSMAILIWGKQPWARALRKHEGFVPFLEREGFIDLWSVYGWPEQCRPMHPGSPVKTALIVE